MVVGSKAFPEGRLLGEILAQTIEARTDLKVERRLGLGGTSVCFDALKREEIDIYAEYTGTGSMLLGQESSRDALQMFLETGATFQEQYGIVWLKPFGFEDSYALAMPVELSEQLGIRTISDLKGNESHIKGGLTHEFLNRDDGWKGLVHHYQLSLDVVGLEHGLAYPAISSGAINLTDAYTTDARLENLGLLVLQDNLGFFPPYQAAPLVREEVLQKYPELKRALNTLAFKIDEKTMRGLNKEVELNGRTEAEVASQFLSGIGESAQSPAKRHSLSALLFSQRTFELAIRHLQITLGATLLVAVCGIPLGAFLAHNERLAKVVFSIADAVQALPSLALLAMLVPLFGLGLKAPIAALFLYGMLPILRNTYSGVKSISQKTTESAKALGLTSFETMRRVEVPLASAAIFAGVRIAAVITVRIATIAAVAGAGGFGDPILLGMQLGNILLILSGAIPAAFFAIAVDLTLAWFGRNYGLLSRSLSSV